MYAKMLQSKCYTPLKCLPPQDPGQDMGSNLDSDLFPETVESRHPTLTAGIHIREKSMLEGPTAQTVSMDTTYLGPVPERRWKQVPCALADPGSLVLCPIQKAAEMVRQTAGAGQPLPSVLLFLPERLDEILRQHAGVTGPGMESKANRMRAQHNGEESPCAITGNALR